MTTPEAEEPAPRRPTGIGWPDPPPAAPPAPSPSPEPALPLWAAQRRDLAAERDATVEPPRRTTTPRDSDFARRAQAYRARSTQSRPWHTSQPERPGTVTAAAVILFIGAGLGLLACCGLNVLASEAEPNDDAQTVLLVVSAVIVVFSLFNAVLGYYVLQGRQWARVVTIVLSAIGIVTSLISLVVAAGGETGGSSSVGTCFGIILNAVIIGLLSGSSASEYFRYARG
jgi:hypothetical protein